ncbi:conserved hypothetical protein [Thiolapillus brandeum]|uniref:Cytochrome c domain-containing protein n=2 Tax=Thiolapillus brandeum TaxID=1076588 RepID=A0A7U6JHJ0_9GAMM|nr:conserved hypothetical protein [Thiolapillus brandeum]
MMMTTVLAGALVLSIVALGEMGMMRGPGMMRGGMMNMSMVRHHYVMRNGIDQRYTSQRNPLSFTESNLQEGENLYTSNCAACHGSRGQGDGEAGKNLNPRPANIARFAKMPMASDGYLLWTISEGGVPVGSAMPPFKDSLKQDDIWKIMLYLRQL